MNTFVSSYILFNAIMLNKMWVISDEIKNSTVISLNNTIPYLKEIYYVSMSISIFIFILSLCITFVTCVFIYYIYKSNKDKLGKLKINMHEDIELPLSR